MVVELMVSHEEAFDVHNVEWSTQYVFRALHYILIISSDISSACLAKIYHMTLGSVISITVLLWLYM